MARVPFCLPSAPSGHPSLLLLEQANPKLDSNCRAVGRLAPQPPGTRAEVQSRCPQNKLTLMGVALGIVTAKRYALKVRFTVR
jgi:hypothetical protein